MAWSKFRSAMNLNMLTQMHGNRMRPHVECAHRRESKIKILNINGLLCAGWCNVAAVTSFGQPVAVRCH